MTYMEQFNSIVRENFDISDTPTRRCIIALEDSEQSQLLSALSSALYDKIVEKVDKIDFGTIPRSRGDITKVDGFENTLECLKIMRQMVVEYHEDPEVVDSILTAIDNIRERKSTFMKAYALNIELPIVFYNLMVLSIEQSVSFLISVCIQYIKDPASEGISAALDKAAYNNSRDNMLYEQIAKFNESCTSGELDKYFANVMSVASKIAEECDMANACAGADCNTPTDSPFQEFPEEKNDIESPIPDEGENPIEVQSQNPTPQQPEIIVPDNNGAVQEFVGGAWTAFTVGNIAKNVITGAGVATAIGALGLSTYGFVIKIFIPLLRSATYYFYYSQVKLSDCLATQAQLIEANAYKLQYSFNSGVNDKQRDKTINKQLKLAEKLKKWSEKFTIDSKRSKKQAIELANSENKKIKIEDLKDDLPADVYSKSVLF